MSLRPPFSSSACLYDPDFPILNPNLLPHKKHLYSRAEVILALDLDPVQSGEDLVYSQVTQSRSDKDLGTEYKEPEEYSTSVSQSVVRCANRRSCREGGDQRNQSSTTCEKPLS
jgi:hypothetical protein